LTKENVENASLVVAVISPAYCEWANLVQLCAPISNLLSQFGEGSRWIIVCEPEPTESDVAQMLMEQPHVRVVSRTPNKTTFADAIQMGLKQLTPNDDVVVFLDADQSHNPDEVPALVGALAKNPELDVVASSRYVKGGRTSNPFHLRMMSRTLNLLFSRMLGVKLQDCSNNFKAYRAPLLAGRTLTSQNFEAVEELLVIATESKGRSLNILEVPGSFRERVEGTSKRRMAHFVGTYLLCFPEYAKRIRRAQSFQG